MLKQYKQNQDLNQRNIYEIRAREKNPKTLPYMDRRVNSLIAGKSFICAWYLLEYVIDTYPEICKHFGQIVELLGLPGCQSLIDDWLDHLSGEKNIGIPEDVKNKYSENVDVIKYMAAIDTFVLDSFNRKKDKGELRWRVTLIATLFSKGSPYLHSAIEFRTLANFYAFDPEKYIDPKIEGIMTSSKDTRVKRKLTQFFSNKDLWDMSHKANLMRDAEIWYKCRVIPGTIEQYISDKSEIMNQQAQQFSDHELESFYYNQQKLKYPDQGDISRLIKPTDIAAGYIYERR
jgi:hypothetical protein